MAAPADLSKLRIDRGAPPAPVKRALGRNLIIFAAAVLVVAVAMILLRARSVPVVQVATATASGAGTGAPGGATSVTANGYVVARTKASVSAKTAGRLASLTVSEGSYVHRGEIIARLDNADFQASVAQAQANVAAADASLIEATADRDQSERDAARIREIRTRNPNLMSQQDLETYTSRAAGAAARFNAAAARKRSAEAGLRLAQASNENTVIRAPFTGTVLRKDAEVGEVVAPSVGGGLTRGAVVTMADLSTLEVEVDVNEAYISRIANGRPARITLDAYPDTSFAATVRQVVPTADRQKATVLVKVAIDDKDPRILPEMGARVDFVPEGSSATAAAAPRRVYVPTAAVSDGKVWLVEQGKAKAQSVTVGVQDGARVEVKDGLDGSETVIVSPPKGLKDGASVRVRTT